MGIQGETKHNHIILLIEPLFIQCVHACKTRQTFLSWSWVFFKA